MKPPVSSGPAPLLFDRHRLARQRDRAASAFADHAFLKARVSSDLAERLNDTPRQFASGLELSAGFGDLSLALLASGKAARMQAADASEKMVAAARARGLEAAQRDDESPALEAGQFDLIVSSLAMHWVNDLPGALIQIRKALHPDGLFLGALFGGGTLTELRDVLIEAESECTGRLSPRLSPLPDLKSLADLLQRAGFALPVADRDRVRVRYASLARLFADLKGMGERAAFMPGISQPLRRDVLMRAAELYAERYADADGRLNATFEIMYLSGWAPGPGQPQPLAPGSARVSLASAIKPQS